MKKLRSFIYLDNYKMYSISSQLFEGLTEYIVNTKSEKLQESESQKGPIGSGKLLADIIEKEANQSEKKFLHDYSYNVFEDTLIKEGRVLEIDASNVSAQINEVEGFSFIKVRGNVIFNDLKIIEKTINNFNEIGMAIGNISMKDSFEGEINSVANGVKDRNQQARIKAQGKSKQTFKNYLMERGLAMDDDFLKNLGYLLNYGYNEQFEVQIPFVDEEGENTLFSAQLIRDNLKDDELAIIKKYSRETEKEFHLFGILTQRLTSEDKDDIFAEFKQIRENVEDPTMKEALINLVSKLTGFERTFTGKLDYEYIIDPIALYIEI